MSRTDKEYEISPHRILIDKYQRIGVVILQAGIKTVKDEIGDEIVYDEHRKCFFSFISNDDVLIELIQPEKTSDIYPLLKRYKNNPYHLCFLL